jgi:putative transposase
LIGDGDHFANAVRYIRKNPVKAKLPEDAFTLWQSERAAKIS